MNCVSRQIFVLVGRTLLHYAKWPIDDYLFEFALVIKDVCDVVTFLLVRIEVFSSDSHAYLV